MYFYLLTIGTEPHLQCVSPLLDFHSHFQKEIMYKSWRLPVPSHFHFHLKQVISCYRVYQSTFFVIVLCSPCILMSSASHLIVLLLSYVSKSRNHVTPTYCSVSPSLTDTEEIVTTV